MDICGVAVILPSVEHISIFKSSCEVMFQVKYLDI